MEPTSSSADLPAVRESFERAWQIGHAPRIEDYLPTESGPNRELVLRELVALDVRHRQILGDKPSVADYVARFPNQSEWLAREMAVLLESAHPSQTPTTPYRHLLPASERSAPPAAVDPPPCVGRYRLEARLGRGGFGEVWRGFDPELQRTVAVKLPRRDRLSSQVSRDLFLAEARKVAALDLPGIVPVYDLGCEDGRSYIVSKYIDGGSLAGLLKRRSLPPSEAARLVADVAAALHRAHLLNIVHRDIKPENILLDQHGTPYVADFGLAITEEEQLLEPRGPVGTFAYMSPEQVAGHTHRIDARSDVYSLGVVLYQMLTGRLPFLAHTPAEYLEQIVDREPRPPRTIDDRIAPELERICLKCMAKSIAERYSTAADLAADLRAFCRADAPAPPKRWHRLAVGVGIAVVLLAVLFLVWRLGRPAGGSDDRPGALRSSDGGEGGRSAEPVAIPRAVGFPPAWRARLGQEPEELFWPGYRGMGTYDHDPELRALRVTSDYPRLIKLGELPDKPCTVSVGFRQVIWGGPAGIFLGYRTELYEGRRCACFQSLFLAKKLAAPAGPVVLALYRTLCLIDSSDGSAVTRKELGHDIVPWPASGVLQRLELQIEGGKLVSARWGDQKLTGITSEYHNNLTSGEEYLGTWGITNQYETTWFRDPSAIVHRGKEEPK